MKLDERVLEIAGELPGRAHDVPICRDTVLERLELLLELLPFLPCLQVGQVDLQANLVPDLAKTIEMRNFITVAMRFAHDRSWSNIRAIVGKPLSL